MITKTIPDMLAELPEKCHPTLWSRRRLLAELAVLKAAAEKTQRFLSALQAWDQMNPPMTGDHRWFLCESKLASEDMQKVLEALK